ncbi:uncharacterized protein QC761_112870 [Podospora bellae-mahoneyi]|uniref:Uncharacterized protein n=1 Tax=Podospora bellae-mahoneyi TaxID=2093777 RepID=A0ABR0FZJ9_9PEZI|nr:hypothetical protein QC761_112870 [Podospora bellae-mahoneyi]
MSGSDTQLSQDSRLSGIPTEQPLIWQPDSSSQPRPQTLATAVTTLSGGSPAFALSTTPAPAGALGDLAAGSQEGSLRDPSDFHHPTSPSFFQRQQQQQQTFQPRPGTVTPQQREDRTPTPSSHRTLRRTPRFSATPSPRPSVTQRRPHFEAAAGGAVPPPIFSLPGARNSFGQPEQVFSSLRRQLSQDLSDDDEETSTGLPYLYVHQRLSSSTKDKPPHPLLSLSKQTQSAILWTLEEALRQPNSFSPDFVEENASMADLLAGSGPTTTNGNGGATTRPTAPPAQPGSPQQVIRGPRMIMRERAEREARQRAEREQMERVRAEEEARLLEESRRRAAERRAPVAGAAPEISHTPSDPASQRRQQRAQEASGHTRMPSSSLAQQQPSAIPPPLRPRNAQTPQNFSSTPQPGAGAVPSQPGADSTSQAMGSSRVKNSFPHAFERWEALSAHWEGMTSFWLRRLQENTDEAERNPISSQLSRQVADLSAAGANLFHAVVELQRLRASTERKFQRWFYETRSAEERHQEVNATLHAQLEQEQQRRIEAADNAAKYEAENAKLQKLVTEMRRELLISKEEARRAWEELGRREQEERERVAALQQGAPTTVGGVPVVVMTQSVPSREPSRHQRSQSQQTADTSEYIAAQGPQYPDYAQSTTSQPRASSPDNHPGYFVPTNEPPRQAQYAAESEAGYDEDDYDETPTSQAEQTNYPPSSSQWAGTYTGQPDYSGQSFAAPGWEQMPRHHHPTRLSDVLEEDERSRTSASQVSRA